MRRSMILGAMLLAGLAGCTQPKTGEPAPQVPDPADAAKLDAAALPEKPANAISVKEALTRNEGEKVVVTGRVPGGKLKPFNAAVAAVVLMAPEDLDREEIKSEFDCDDAAT